IFLVKVVKEIIALQLLNESSFLIDFVACPESWIKYNGKCLYVSKEERDWLLSLETCSSFNASLAVIDTQKELVRNKETS
uniref:Uncharacterized protein n=1 Tax=Naja naja TaxID=35670 RepID=A0A8C6X0T1_NAJNA